MNTGRWTIACLLGSAALIAVGANSNEAPKKKATDSPRVENGRVIYSNGYSMPVDNGYRMPPRANAPIRKSAPPRVENGRTNYANGYSKPIDNGYRLPTQRFGPPTPVTSKVENGVIRYSNGYSQPVANSYTAPPPVTSRVENGGKTYSNGYTEPAIRPRVPAPVTSVVENGETKYSNGYSQPISNGYVAPASVTSRVENGVRIYSNGYTEPAKGLPAATSVTSVVENGAVRYSNGYSQPVASGYVAPSPVTSRVENGVEYYTNGYTASLKKPEPTTPVTSVVENGVIRYSNGYSEPAVNAQPALQAVTSHVENNTRYYSNGYSEPLRADQPGPIQVTPTDPTEGGRLQLLANGYRESVDASSRSIPANVNYTRSNATYSPANAAYTPANAGYTAAAANYTQSDAAYAPASATYRPATGSYVYVTAAAPINSSGSFMDPTLVARPRSGASGSWEPTTTTLLPSRQTPLAALQQLAPASSSNLTATFANANSTPATYDGPSTSGYYYGKTFALVGGLAEVAVTKTNSGTTQETVTSGELLHRVSVYTTTNDAGVCWSPGISIGQGTFETSVAGYACLGTDGGTIAGDVSALGYVFGLYTTLIPPIRQQGTNEQDALSSLFDIKPVY